MSGREPLVGRDIEDSATRLGRQKSVMRVFDVRKHAFGREDRLQGLSVTQKLSRFQARREPVTGLPARGRSGRDPRDMSDVKPHRGGDRL